MILRGPEKPRNRATTVTASVTALGLCASVGCGGSTGDTEADSLVINVAEQSYAGTTSGLYAHMADELGFFEDEGIEIGDYVSVTAGSEAINGMISGDVQVSHIGPEAISAAAQGADVVGIAAAMDASMWSVIAAPDIETWEDLRGETIALGSLSDITRVVFDELAREAGLDPDQDLEYVALGATPQRVAAVENGQVGATMATYPTVSSVLRDGDVTDLGFAPEGADPPAIIATDIEASSQWAEENPDAVAGYLRAIIRAVDFVKDPENEDEAVSLTAELADESPEAVSDAFEVYFYDPAVDNAYFPDDFRHGEGVFDKTVEAYMELDLISDAISEDDYMDYTYLEMALADQ